MKGTKASLTHIRKADANLVSSALVSQNPNQPSQKTPFAIQRTYPKLQPRELEPSFEARMQEYMASHMERIQRFERAIFKKRGEINRRIAEIFRLLKELTSSTTPEKVLVSEEIRKPTTKNVNAISLCRIENEKIKENNEVIDKNIIKQERCSIEEPVRIVNNGPLRIPFPMTARAEIKFDKGTTALKSGRSKVHFRKCPEFFYKFKERNEDKVDSLSIVSDRILEWEERIKFHQERDLEFNQWRNKLFNEKDNFISKKGEKETGREYDFTPKEGLKNKSQMVKTASGKLTMPSGSASNRVKKSFDGV
uniref:Uncharacterized protein n=1 Tax=Tanacetum cinerariifolium TaxID=118510 RepID=A0A6L2NAN7_TANCI|nr:hypothetical protein [Tanacetum cinerariifolium]